MLYFLQTIGLLAAAGIIFPVAIHLWNKKEGKTLRIGSVRLLVESSWQQARRLRLKDLLLLLLRCTIIFFLALLLAKPFWQKQLFTKEMKGWIVIQENGGAYKNYKGQIDSLLHMGFEVHRFTEGFPLIKPNDIAQSIHSENPIAYWTLLKALNEQVPDDLPVYLFTNNRISEFTGSRPSVRMNLHWLTFASSDTITGNVVATRLMAKDSIEIVTANSKTTSTTYERQKLPTATGRDSVFSKADTNTLRIAIMKDLPGNDATYLEAAIRAIQQFGQYRMQLTTTADPSSLVGNYNWVFWLSQKEPPATLRAGNIFRYETGKEKTVFTWIDGLGNNEKIKLSGAIINDTFVSGWTIWANGYKEPVLTYEKGIKNIYHFYSRFDPAWNGLVWSESFPQLLFDILLKKENKNEEDNRIIDTQQLQPAITKAGVESSKPAFIETTDLTKWVWVVAFLLFALERIIVLKTKRDAHA